ncbi:MAG: ethanolamine ammonia-lyase subunit EutB [Thermodesulfobacteriota bacterium]
MKGLFVTVLIASVQCLGILGPCADCRAASVRDIKPGEDVFGYINRVNGSFDQTLYRKIIGAANEFKEGDQAIEVSAEEMPDRENARKLLVNTRIRDIHEHPLLEDSLQRFIWESTDRAAYEKVQGWTLGQLKDFLLTKDEPEIKGIMGGLDSDVIGCVPKLMSNEELISVCAKIFNPLPGRKIGEKGYLGARIQPNSPTDDPDEIAWQIFDAWSYGVGDLLIGTNPVDGSRESTEKIETVQKDIVDAFQLNGVLPWCVLSHIDVQREVDTEKPGLVALMFQSLAGTDKANQTFDISVEKMVAHARSRRGKRYGLYYETGQGADFTNGAADGVDMVVLESRKYGFARGLKQELERVQPGGAYTHFNDVAGFIGPEVFRSREQLVRCCLEDILMGKLHGLCAGLDVCSTLHMSVSLDDLDWCLEEIMPANPAYLMALPTKNDPMLSYLTTSYQDHVRLREKFGYKVDDAMQAFFQRIRVIDDAGKPTAHFGDPIWVYYQYRLAKGDTRSEKKIMAEGQQKFDAIHGTWLKTGYRVPLARGHAARPWDMNPELDAKVRFLYADAKKAVWSELTPEFVQTIPNAVRVGTESKNRENYIVRQDSGEKLNPEAVRTLADLRDSWKGKVPDVQVVICDGLNANSIMARGHVLPYLDELKKQLRAAGLTLGAQNIVVTNGRVRAGYAIGDILFGDSDPKERKAIVNIIGERPGTGQNAFSVYIAAPKARIWAEKKCNHDIVKVVSGISTMATKPEAAARMTVKLLNELGLGDYGRLWP